MSGEGIGGGPAEAPAPQGFEILGCTSPLAELLGPFYTRAQDEASSPAPRVAEKHANARGFAHGGVLLTLADVALGYAAEGSVEPPVRLITPSLSADFAGGAKVADWVEARVDVRRVGGRLAFANCYLYVGEQRVVRANVVFARAGSEGGER